MTTPADNTPYGVILDAYLDAGLLQTGDDPSSEQIATGMRRLRDLINVEQTQGLKLWVNVDTAVPLVAAQATYTLAPGGDVDMTKPLRVLQAYYADDNTPANRRPLIAMSWNEYLNLGQVAQQGAINSYFVNKQAASLIVTFWPTPSTEAATGTAHLLLQVQITNPTTLTETMQFPTEWRMFLHWGLAAEVCTGQPQSVIQRCEQKAALYRRALEDWDVEDAATLFQPDPRSGYNNGQMSFR